MTSARLGAALLLLLAGATAAGSLPRIDLHFEERVLIGVVTAVLAGSAVTFLLALLTGLSVVTVLGGGVLTAVALGSLSWRRRDDALRDWRDGWRELTAPGRRRHAGALVAVALLSTGFFGFLFVHTMTVSADGGISAGFQTVWADWSQHLTTASSFAVAHNLPAQNPLFSGQDLRYPFLPDFQSATLMTLGASPALALALPGALLAVCITLLITVLAGRLGAGLAAGALAAAICMVGGGVGFTGILADACLHHGFSTAQCTWSGLVAHPTETPSIILGTLRDLPGLVAAQPRAYDGLLTTASAQPLPNQQWYTPLFAWWLPQRTILYGFAGALAVLLLVVTARRAPRRGYESFALAGVLLGLMPLIHIHTLIAMAVVCTVLAMSWRHRGWWITATVTTAIAAPRLLTLLGGPHGSAHDGNVFPTVEAGWMYVTSGARPALSPGSLAGAVGGLLRAGVSPQYWGFWIANTGAALPLCAVTAIAVLLARLPGRAGAAGRRVTAAFPSDLLRVALALIAVFVLANLVVFQSWDWDNTKLLVYWYLGVALLIGTLVTRWWRRWRRVAAVGLSAVTLLTGILVLLRLLPWTPPADAVGGPYTSVTAADAHLAAVVAASTSRRAIFLTEGKPNDPVLELAGRTAVLGYYGWLWSYGTDFGTRPDDVRTMLEGCKVGSTQTCPVVGLLHRYDVSYAEIDDRLTDPGVIDSAVGLAWWAAQGFPVVARSDHVTVYDVRASSR